MKQPRAITIDIVDSKPAKIDITFLYEKTYKGISFLATVEDLPEVIGKRYRFIKKSK